MITSNRLHKSRSVGTKLSTEQYAAVELRAHEQGVGVSEYVRQTLLAAHHQPDFQAVLLVLLQELMALRVVYLNVLHALASGEQFSPDGMRACIARADADKAAKAQDALRATVVANRQSATEGKEAA